MKKSRLRLRARTLAVTVFALVVAAASAALVHASGSSSFPVQLVRVTVPTQADRDRLTDLGLDLTEHAGHTYVEAVLHTPADAATLADNGFAWTVTIPDLAVREQQNNEVNAAYAAATDVSPLPSGRDTYRTLADYEADLQDLAAGNPGLVKAFTLNHASQIDATSSAQRPGRSR